MLDAVAIRKRQRLVDHWRLADSEAAVKLLARYGDDSVVKPVAALAMADSVLRNDCIVALVSIGTPDAAKAIEAMLKRTKEPREREKLLAAIDQINRKAE